MRNKPTIIAFKTPSLESCEQRPSQNSIGSMSKSNRNDDNQIIKKLCFSAVVSPGIYTEKEAEEGRIFKRSEGNYSVFVKKKTKYLFFFNKL